MSKRIEQTVLKAVIPMKYTQHPSHQGKANQNSTESPPYLSEHLLSGSQQDG